jgi:hypothetical protein
MLTVSAGMCSLHTAMGCVTLFIKNPLSQQRASFSDRYPAMGLYNILFPGLWINSPQRLGRTTRLRKQKHGHDSSSQRQCKTGEQRKGSPNRAVLLLLKLTLLLLGPSKTFRTFRGSGRWQGNKGSSIETENGSYMFLYITDTRTIHPGGTW